MLGWIVKFDLFHHCHIDPVGQLIGENQQKLCWPVKFLSLISLSLLRSLAPPILLHSSWIFLYFHCCHWIYLSHFLRIKKLAFLSRPYTIQTGLVYPWLVLAITQNWFSHQIFQYQIWNSFLFNKAQVLRIFKQYFLLQWPHTWIISEQLCLQNALRKFPGKIGGTQMVPLKSQSP